MTRTAPAQGVWSQGHSCHAQSAVSASCTPNPPKATNKEIECFVKKTASYEDRSPKVLSPTWQNCGVVAARIKLSKRVEPTVTSTLFFFFSSSIIAVGVATSAVGVAYKITARGRGSLAPWGVAQATIIVKMTLLQLILCKN